MSQKTIWIAGILLLVLATAVVLQGIDKEMSRIDIIPDNSLSANAQINTDSEESQAPVDIESDDGSFFESYRLERERTRSREEETLTDLINNQNADEESKKNAEKQLLQLTDDIECEIRIENMIKAMGFEQVVFFNRGDEATVAVSAEEIPDSEFLEIIQIVSQVAEIDPHTVNVMLVDN